MTCKSTTTYLAWQTGGDYLWINQVWVKHLGNVLSAVTSAPPDPVTSPRLMNDWGQ
ncbi:hypothetical protein AB8H46_002797 [Salmonella enterica]